MEEVTFIQSSHQVQQCPCSLSYKENASASQASDIQLQNLLEALSEPGLAGALDRIILAV